MEKKTHFSIWYIMGVIVFMLFVQALLSVLLIRPNIQQVHYSEFMKNQAKPYTGTPTDVTFDDVSTGAQNDLQKATEIARKIVAEFGMNDRIGLTTLEKPQQLFLGTEQQFGLEKRYSPVTAELIDEEVRDILIKLLCAVL